ncbi:MAG TPA: sensor histidine kinase [Streptosporangiaceae bacterium]|nr:sensor histidine kinase [Streptosporangiaceae bacterium]
MSVDDPATPTLAALRRARGRQEAAQRLLRPAGLVVALLVIARSLTATPAPGWAGTGLGVALAVAAIAAGAAGVLAAYRSSRWVQLTFFLLYLSGSVALYWLQPGGAGLVAALVAVGLMTRWLPVRLTVVPVTVTLVVAGMAGAADGRHHPASAILLSEVGLIAVYGVAMLTRRVGQGNVQTERLLTELEQVRGAEVRAAALAERQRLAREMHDVLAHSLSGLALKLEGARLLAAADPADPRLVPVINRSHQLATTGVQEARWAIETLRGGEVPGPERLATLVADFEHDSGIPCRLTVTGARRPLEATVSLAVYRVAQEALTNVRKHSRASRVEVGLDYEPGGISLRVEDAGPAAVEAAGGADLTAASAGYGLVGMRERAELLGGTLRAAATSHGFRVTMRVPACAGPRNGRRG